MKNGSSANKKFSKTQLSKVVQFGGFILGLPDIFHLPTKGSMSIVNSVANESKKTGGKKLNKDSFVDAGLNIIGKNIKKGILSITDSGITHIKDIIKVVKSLENKGISSKGTTTKVTSQEGWFLNFLSSLMTAGLPLMKSVLTPLAKSVLIPIVLSIEISAADA